MGKRFASGLEALDGIDLRVARGEFLSLLGTENLLKAKFLKRSERIVAMNSPLIDELRDVLERGAKTGVFRQGIDPLYVYLTMAALGFFYLSNRWTLSTIFRRDLQAKEEIDSWGQHMVDVILSYLRP